ncbi:hypothetical protein P153DRAFT_385728 [Dothidotthia symphoricarpi CBS 119687]|uniref:Uncharacterized protein n=1 Tax=Dothidotthia symphoricarpi CBS 119687 TaxID=1392245 RepID=A0A6A6AE09_9PLEO|nr:uncharacterized protein P153DRAFT_385728 [Dothidotthia symphoricarpi CBS 119687]KAF2129523.1 hypothetical protein P153DRAFT_385728 [Dothidotthia symphoricarpi CBS 119687]
MSTPEDDDLKLQRASASLLSDFEKLLPRLLRKRRNESSSGQVRQQVREVDMNKAFVLIQPFQEDPQLLDSHLKSFIPPLVSAYLESLSATSQEKPKKGFLPLSHAICQILNLLCKVRGEKVIKGFLNNEPRYLEPILQEFETGKNFQSRDEGVPSQSIVPWVERYILLLWLSHLMLAPFPLSSMSRPQSTEDMSTAFEIALPSEAPGITLRTLSICFECLRSASKERSAAANLLVTLCVRPDMQKLGLLDTLVKWSMSFFSRVSEDQADIHESLGVLSFLSRLVASATNEEIGPFLAAIYRSCRSVLDQESLAFVKSSAVARKLIVKILRNIVIHCLQATSAPLGLDPTSILEEVIEFLLEALADGDTPVRYGASKALSIITLKLDSELAEEVVDAILGSLNENVYWQGSKRNLSGVNPLRWHGLTLTLSHLLYRRAISTGQLPDALNALLLSLGFEQRSPTGGSVGTNVRDAACFGIWALSRRYATSDLLAVETSSIRASEHRKTLSVPQVLAIELVIVACLDPAGNIRRGSSAALQELIGRNPNTVEEGIPLVQVVDFHAVGLRQRAMCEVAIKAGKLQSMYWEALSESLLDWRGTGSLDSDSRLAAAEAVGLLSKDQPPEVVRQMSDQVRGLLGALRPREVEERQGLVSALSALVNTSNISTSLEGQTTSKETTVSKRGVFIHLWKLLDNELGLEEKAFTSPALRPELTASSVCNFIAAMAAMTNMLPKDSWPQEIPTVEITRLLNLCLVRHEESVLEAIIPAAAAVLPLLAGISGGNRDGLVSTWLSKLENEASYSGLRCSGHAVALGAAYGVLTDRRVDGLLNTNGTATEPQMRIVKVLTFRCTPAVAIEARTVALRALGILLRSCRETILPTDIKDQIASALHIALNDYTITERGDVGSLVRLEALNTVSSAWTSNIFKDEDVLSDQQIYTDILRLSLEKLDKVRARAAQIMEKGFPKRFAKASSTTTDDVSSHAYFATALAILQSSTTPAIKQAICLGFVSSAGMGSESVVQNSRAALLDLVDALPDSSTSDAQHFTLTDLANCLSDLVKGNLDNDRTVIPLLEVIAFLFDMQIMQRLTTTSSFNFRTLLSLTQKAHFKSSHMQKLHLALDVYRGLGTIPATRADTLTKVASMLLHPFPKIRITAAETLWILTREDGLKRQDWSLPGKSLKSAVEGIKTNVMATATTTTGV